MQKSEYDRYSLEENQLKKVLIRIDYSGAKLQLMLLETLLQTI